MKPRAFYSEVWFITLRPAAGGSFSALPKLLKIRSRSPMHLIYCALTNES